MSIINTAVSAMAALLQAAPAIAAQVDRVYLRPIPKGHASAVVVRPSQSDVSEASMVSGYPISWLSVIAVECYTRAATGVAPDVAVDALLEAAYARLMADPTLGDAVIGLQPKGIRYEFDSDGERTACATLFFHVRHRTSGNTLT